ncbi:MAG TPA: DNA polymerase/3'-5' exonuclease PolX [Longimicrobiaceae bacterium]|nr:DNA polymerase/3'-5' exonuclease PolX [Longimicrobiaceae bacterium]
MSERQTAPLDAGEVARLLADIGTLSELNGANPFRARAFASAARALEGTSADLSQLAAEGKLTSLAGVGPAIAEVIDEIVRTGRSTIHEELTATTPIGLYDLMRIPGLGNKRIHTLHTELGVDSLESLATAAEAGRVAALPGFGKKTEQKILKGIGFARAALGRRRYPDAREVAERLLEWLGERSDVVSADIVGQVRRRLEVVDRVDLLAATDDVGSVLEALGTLHGVAELTREDERRVVARLNDGLTARLRCVAPDLYAAALAWETGSEEHVAGLQKAASAQGFELTEAGLLRGGEAVRISDEERLYEELGLQYVPPELREGLGEVEMAAEGTLPNLVVLEDLRGTFHCHTTYSDGKATIAEMGEAARAHGWSYLGLADHSRAAAYAGGLSVERVHEQQDEIDGWNSQIARSGEKFRIFKGIESDILADGSLDYDEEVLASFDYIVGSVHSGFGMSEAAMTERVVRAIRNPYLTILGHPTGRLLLRRSGYPIDVRAVIEAAASAGVVIEINSNPHRLDLDWRDVREAAERGILIAINPDAHSVAALDNVAYGINMARKAGLEARQILNTWTLAEVESYLAERNQKS